MAAAHEVLARYHAAKAPPFRVASLWSRGLALMIDALVVVLLYQAILTIAWDSNQFAALAAALGCIPVYFIVGHGGQSGQTLGKRLLGIAVRNERGRSIGYDAAAVRWLAAVALGLLPPIWLLDGLAAARDERGRSWHDRVARSVVIRV
jgi:uncharacterized RDD family membrane protein YckC